MAWVVDTSVLLDIHLDDPAFGRSSAKCLARQLGNGLVPCPVSFIELSPAFAGDGALQQRFLQEAGVNCLEPWIWQDTQAAHRFWALHVARNRSGEAKKRPAADVFIESFSERFQGLITRNPRDFRSVPTLAPT